MAEQLGWSRKEKERQTEEAIDFLKKQMGKGANRLGILLIYINYTKWFNYTAICVPLAIKSPLGLYRILTPYQIILHQIVLKSQYYTFTLSNSLGLARENGMETLNLNVVNVSIYSTYRL